MLESAGASTSTHPTLSLILDIADKVIKLLAVLLGGAWTLWHYRKSRTYEQKLELEVTGTVFVKDDLYGDVKITVKNIGEGVHPVQHEGTFCILSVIHKDLSEEEVRLFRVFQEQTKIEPGESLNDNNYWRIPQPFDDIVWIKLTQRVVSNGVEWCTTCLVRVEDRNQTIEVV